MITIKCGNKDYTFPKTQLCSKFEYFKSLLDFEYKTNKSMIKEVDMIKDTELNPHILCFIFDNYNNRKISVDRKYLKEFSNTVNYLGYKTECTTTPLYLHMRQTYLPHDYFETDSYRNYFNLDGNHYSDTEQGIEELNQFLVTSIKDVNYICYTSEDIIQYIIITFEDNRQQKYKLGWNCIIDIVDV